MSQNNITQSKRNYETFQDLDAANEGVSETTVAIVNADTTPFNDLEETIVDNTIENTDTGNSTDTIHTTAITSTALVKSNKRRKHTTGFEYVGLTESQLLALELHPKHPALNSKLITWAYSHFTPTPQRELAPELLMDNETSFYFTCKHPGCNTKCSLRERSSNSALTNHLKFVHLVNNKEYLTSYLARKRNEEFDKPISQKLATLLVKTNSPVTIFENSGLVGKLTLEEIANSCNDISVLQLGKSASFHTLVAQVNEKYEKMVLKSFTPINKEFNINLNYGNIDLNVDRFIQQFIRNILEDNFIGISHDSWTSRTGNHYIAFNAHFLNKANEIKVFLLGFLPQKKFDHQGVFECWKQIVKKYKFLSKNSVCFTSDNAAVAIKSSKFICTHLDDEVTDIKTNYNVCFLHCISLFTKSFFGLTLKRKKRRLEHKDYQGNIEGEEREEYERVDDEILANGELECTFDDEECEEDSILDVLHKINMHHTCFKRSPKHTRMFRNIVMQKLKREILLKEWIHVRWNSLHDALSRALELEEVLLLPEYKAIGIKADAFTERDFQIIKELIKITSILQNVILFYSQNEPHYPLIMVSLMNLLNFLQPIANRLIKIKVLHSSWEKDFKKQFRKYSSKYKNNDLLRVATSLLGSTSYKFIDLEFGNSDNESEVIVKLLNDFFKIADIGEINSNSENGVAIFNSNNDGNNNTNFNSMVPTNRNIVDMGNNTCNNLDQISFENLPAINSNFERIYKEFFYGTSNNHTPIASNSNSESTSNSTSNSTSRSTSNSTSSSTSNSTSSSTSISTSESTSNSTSKSTSNSTSNSISNSTSNSTSSSTSNSTSKSTSRSTSRSTSSSASNSDLNYSPSSNNNLPISTNNKNKVAISYDNSGISNKVAFFDRLRKIISSTLVSEKIAVNQYYNSLLIKNFRKKGYTFKKGKVVDENGKEIDDNKLFFEFQLQTDLEVLKTFKYQNPIFNFLIKWAMTCPSTSIATERTFDSATYVFTKNKVNLEASDVNELLKLKAFNLLVDYTSVNFEQDLISNLSLE